MPNAPKRPRDLNQWAKRIDIAPAESLAVPVTFCGTGYGGRRGGM
jgi:hypothetical protein